MLIIRHNKGGSGDGKQHHDLWAGLLQKMEADNLIESHSYPKASSKTAHSVIVEDLENNHVSGFQSSSVRSYVPISSATTYSYEPISSSTSSYDHIPRSVRPDVPISSLSSNPQTVNETPVLFQAAAADEKEEKPTENVSSFKFENVAEPLTISFKGLKLFLKANQQMLLTNVSGVVKHHKVTALMGPSGAGRPI